jgi:hypothetical protein
MPLQTVCAEVNIGPTRLQADLPTIPRKCG